MKAKTAPPAETNIDLPVLALTPKDFASDQDVRWCPGCGDYSILAQVQRTMPDLHVTRHETVFVAGIGCSSRFPYYMNTYGFHGIHGRAPAIASGVKAANPNLSVWVATGDGDGLSIGGNHTLHMLRRNFNLNVLLFNNRIYGLTKGQYSPTSEHGKKTKSTPYGSIDHPINPVLFAIGCEATFVARSIDREPKHMQEVIKRAYEHKGTAFMEIYQNCNIFNDGAFLDLTEKDVKDDHILVLRHSEPMIFGKQKEKAITLDGFTPKVVNVAEVDPKDILKHDEKDAILATILARMSEMEGFPVPIGIFLSIDRTTYEDEMAQQIATAKQKSAGDLKKLLNSGNTWMVN
ncbi:MAG TPA: 2-oxoacid:ferredoxin oxidoreductase subunit beta [Candidatus Kapabacteria bacterium]|nr:2-oxoacid:ferredoxin oxidoreductase subunit beta [Candidatus Kapabacteria bacterium]